MPIEINLQNIAIKTAIRLYSNKCWYPDTNLGCKKSYISHARHLDKELKHLKQYIHSPLNENFEPRNITLNFSISQHEIIDPRICEPKTNYIHIFTDGSVIESKDGKQAGAGILIQNGINTILEKQYYLGEMTTINQAEMFAINEAAKYLKTNNLATKNINIFTDSLNSIQKLNKSETNSLLTIETVNNLNDLSSSYNITLHKVKAHIGIQGNELADRLAKKGANEKQIGPEPFLFLPKTIIRDILRAKMINSRSKKINEANIKQENKELLKSYLKNKPPKLALVSKIDLKNLTGIISGQNHLSHNKNKMNNNISPLCKHCPEMRETTEHFMSDCPAYSHIRQEVFQTSYLPIQQIFEQFNPKTICRYINKTERMTEENTLQ